MVHMFLSNPNGTLHSSMDLTHSHSPRRFSFHSVTLLSAPLTARTLPLRDQLTRQTAASKLRTLQSHWPAEAASEVQMRTVLSWEAEAMYDFCRTVGDQATSRTQSAW